MLIEVNDFNFTEIRDPNYVVDIVLDGLVVEILDSGVILVEGGAFTGTLDDIADGTNRLAFLPAERTKLASIAAGATVNSTDAQLRDRSTHTGTQTAATISDFSTAADARITAQKGVALGLVPLDATTKISTSYLPAAVLGGLNYQGTWNASTNSPALTSSVGTKGYYYKVSTAGVTNLDGTTDWKVGDWATYNGTIWEKVDNTDQVVSVNGFQGTVVLTKTDIGLGNVDNTSDASKPVSTATQTALDLKVSGPASSVDNTVPRFDQTTGKIIQGSGVIVDDSNNVYINAASPVGALQIGNTGAHGTLRYVSNGVLSYFGIYDSSNARFYGISERLPAPAGTSMLGGYYGGLGVGGAVNNATPIFGVLNSSQSGNGRNQVAFTIYGNNVVDTFKNRLDDGAGNMDIVGTISTATWAGVAISDTYIASAAAWNAKQDKVLAAPNVVTADYTLVLADEYVSFNKATDGTITIPPNSSVAFPLRKQLIIEWYGVGQPEILAGAGVTLRSAEATTKIAKQYGAVTLIQRATDEWMVIGNLEA